VAILARKNVPIHPAGMADQEEFFGEIFPLRLSFFLQKPKYHDIGICKRQQIEVYLRKDH
jgi:hypothetical protein